MDFIPYNSRLTYHKSPFGAVREGVKTVFRIVLPRDFGCTGACLNIRMDNCGSDLIPMTWERMEGEHEEWWRVEYTPRQSGLYYYRFNIYNSYSENAITDFGASTGRISADGRDFMFLVYDRDFDTPRDIRGSVIYQIFPDRFCNSGEKKQDVPQGRILRYDWGGEPRWQPDENGRISGYDFFGGDLKGIESRLKYLSGLGVGIIYLNPIFLAESNHRYDTADYEKIDPLLGTERDFADLCKSAASTAFSATRAQTANTPTRTAPSAREAPTTTEIHRITAGINSRIIPINMTAGGELTSCRRQTKPTTDL